MPRQKSKPSKRKPTSAAAERETVLREVCSHLHFRKLCGDKACKRADACAGDAEACFAHHWPLVPQEVKMRLRAVIRAGVAGLPRVEIDAQVERELAQWRETQSRAEAPPPQAPPRQACAARLRVL